MAPKSIGKAVMDRLISRQKSLKDRIEQGRTVAEGVNSPFWKAYRNLIENKLANSERELYGTFQAKSNEQLRCLLTTIKDMKFFIEGPSDFEKSIEIMEDKLEKVKVEIDERKSKL